MFMKSFINQIIKLLKWLFKWIKYIIIILICVIYSLFYQEKSKKLERKKENLKHEIKKNEQRIQDSTIFNENNPLIKDSIFKITEEQIKEEIKNYYCEKKERKVYELTKEEEKEIEKLTEIILPIIVTEINKEQILNQDKLKDKITKLGKEYLPQIVKETTIIKTITPKETKRQKEDLPIKKTNEHNQKEIDIVLTSRKKEENITNNKKEEPDFIKDNPLPSPLFNKNKENLSEATPKINLQPNFIISPNIPKIEENLITNIPPSPQINIEHPPKTDLDIKIVTGNQNELSPPEEQTEKNIDTKNSQESPKENLELEKTKEIKYITINSIIIDTQIKELKEEKRKEQNKPEFEDKNYDAILLKIDLLLKELKTLQTKPLKNSDQEKVKKQIQELKQTKKEIEIRRESELTREEDLLQETITEQELSTLEQELKKLHLEHLTDLNEKLLTKVEDLDNLSKKQTIKIEKELIKLKIKKTCKSLELPFLISLPFIRNRYFFGFTAALFINNHLNFLNSILKRRSILYEDPKLAYIKKGSDALEEAIKLTNNNLSYLVTLEEDILSKYPELSLDEEYLIYINKLKYSLMINQEKMLKKRKMIEKYNLKYQVKIRKLKKKKIA